MTQPFQLLTAFFDARPINAAVQNGDPPKMIELTVNHFFAACLEASRFQYANRPMAVDWEDYFRQRVQRTYLEIAAHAQVYTLIDQQTGEHQVDTRACYERYFELMGSLNKYYRLDAIALLRQLDEQYVVHSIRFGRHTPYYLMVVAACQLGLPYVNSPRHPTPGSTGS